MRYILVLQRFRVVYHGISNLSLAYSRYTHSPLILGKFATFNERVFILNFGRYKIAVRGGKVGCNAAEYKRAFLYHELVVFFMAWYKCIYNMSKSVLGKSLAFFVMLNLKKK